MDTRKSSPEKEIAQQKRLKIKIVTYNVHKCKGIDGRILPERIVDVLREIDADVIALQEVISYKIGGSAHQARFIGDALGMNCVYGTTIENGKYEYGNVVLTRLPIALHYNHDISVHHREPRGCLQVDLIVGATRLHIFNAHFGTSYLERVRQAKALFQYEILAGSHIYGPRVLVGDFNDWFPGRASRLLRAEFRDPSHGIRAWRKRTHPCLLPLFKLDKIFTEQSIRISGNYVHRSKFARVASDHLPLVANVEVPQD